jgi:hypothetical protein
VSRSIRIETALQGWYPNPGLVIDVDGEDWVIESTTPDADAVWRIDAITRHCMPLSVIAELRPVTQDESDQSGHQEKQDVDEWLKTAAR